MKKADIIAKIQAFPYRADDFWVITGAAMVLYGIREETVDIDLGCTSRLADRLESEGLLYRVMDDGNRWFRIGGEIEVFENWLYDAVVLIGNTPVVSLRGLREMKQRLGREKDMRDLKLIDDFLSR